VDKKYGRKGYPQRSAAHMGSISLWISVAASIFFVHKKRTTNAVLSRYMYSGRHFFVDILCFHMFCPQKTHNATLFYRGTYIQGRRHLVTAATSVVMRIPIVVGHNKTI
jgi:hypothetical protein